MSKASIAGKLDEMERKLGIDLSEAPHSPLGDAVKVMAPVFLELIKINRELLEMVDALNQEVSRGPDPRLMNPGGRH